MLIADDSVLIGEGLAVVLKQLHAFTCEVAMAHSLQAMKTMMAASAVDIVVVNPYFDGGFDLASSSPQHLAQTQIALLARTHLLCNLEPSR